ncbi:MAG: hypothetical protein AAF205_08075 [Pseudomonadota bacterium]
MPVAAFTISVLLSEIALPQQTDLIAQIERECGAIPGSLVDEKEEGSIVISLSSKDAEISKEITSCIISRSHELKVKKVGFIGNTSAAQN